MPPRSSCAASCLAGCETVGTKVLLSTCPGPQGPTCPHLPQSSQSAPPTCSLTTYSVPGPSCGPHCWLSVVCFISAFWEFLFVFFSLCESHHLKKKRENHHCPCSAKVSLIVLSISIWLSFFPSFLLWTCLAWCKKKKKEHSLASCARVPPDLGTRDRVHSVYVSLIDSLIFFLGCTPVGVKSSRFPTISGFPAADALSSTPLEHPRPLALKEKVPNS